MAELKYDISPSNAPRFAADIVQTTKRLDGIVLDYSIASLEKVDDHFRIVPRETFNPSMRVTLARAGELG